MKKHSEFLPKLILKVKSIANHQWVRFFSYPLNSIKETLDYNDYWKHRRSNLGMYLGTPQQLRLSRLITIVDNKKISSAVDVGGADGSFIYFLQKRKPEISRSICIDSSEYALQNAKVHGIETIQVNLSNNDELSKIPNADLIYALEVLEHVPNSESLLRNMYEKSDVAVVFSFPNTAFITYRIRLLLGRFPMQWVMHPSEHLRFWTFSDVRWWLNALGYENYTLYSHRGIPILNKLFPNLFSADIFVCLKKK